MACLKYSVWLRDEQEGSKGRTVYHEITFLMHTFSTGTEHTSQLSKSNTVVCWLAQSEFIKNPIMDRVNRNLSAYTV